MINPELKKPTRGFHMLDNIESHNTVKLPLQIEKVSSDYLYPSLRSAMPGLRMDLNTETTIVLCKRLEKRTIKTTNIEHSSTSMDICQ